MTPAARPAQTEVGAHAPSAPGRLSHGSFRSPAHRSASHGSCCTRKLLPGREPGRLAHDLVPLDDFGSIAGLPPAAMRYTEARLSAIAALMLEDLKLDTVDYLPTYDERRLEPTVLPSKFPNLLVNGANGIAVGMATSIPPHNLGEICDAMIRVIDDPDVSIDELLEIAPGPDFPTGGVVCGRARHPPGISHGPQHDCHPRPQPRSRNTRRIASASSSRKSPSSRPATASRSGSPRW